MPHSNDGILVTAAGDGDVRVFDIERSGSSSIPPDPAFAKRRIGLNTVYNGVRYLGEPNTNVRVYRSHSDRVKRIVTESSPYLFLSCSEDGEVRQWDLRQPSSAYPPPRSGKGFGAPRSSRDRDNSNVPPPLISYTRYQLDLNTISCSASQPHYIALGGAHLHCFLHDRRMLGRDVFRERGSPSSPTNGSGRQEELMNQATRCVRRFAPNGIKKMKRGDNGHITACKISDANPNEMVVSWSGDWIYSFDLIRSPGAEQTDDDGPRSLSKGQSETRVKESRNRKRKRDKPGSGSLSGRKRGPSSRRHGEENTRLERDVALRVRYVNGQSEDIQIEPPTRRPEVPRAARGDPQERIINLAHTFVKVREEILGLRSSRLIPNPPQSSSDCEYTASATSTVGYAMITLRVMGEVMRRWRYPQNPTEEEVLLQQTLRRNRESAYRLIQAAGTIARILGGRFQTAGHDQSLALAYFKQITPAPNEQNPLKASTQFSYDFIKAILSWLKGGRQGLLRAFKRKPDTRRDSQRFPIPDNAGLEAIDNLLIPYLLRLESGRSIPDVDAEASDVSTVFESEAAAVTAFSNAINIPFCEDSHADAATTNEGHEEGILRNVQGRQTAVRFWAFRVARGLLMNEGIGLNYAFVLRAFGGMTIGWPSEDSGQEDDYEVEEGPELSWTPIAESSGTVSETETEAQDDRYRQGTVDAGIGGNLLTEFSGASTPISQGTSDEHMIAADEMPEDNVQSSDDIDEDEQDFADDDAEEREYMWESTSGRSKLREGVEADVPFSPHTRVYTGHCNVDTVKDVNFYGLQDEYVVSGSDSGHLFIWDRRTTQLVNILEGDKEVVNVVQGMCHRRYFFGMPVFASGLRTVYAMLGHPYEPMLAVSGIDHTVKIFSPDQLAQDDARNGINISHNASSGSSSLESGGISRFTRRRSARRSTSATAAQRDDNNEADVQGASNGGEKSQDDCTGPVAIGGLASRRRMHRSYEIMSQNDLQRQGGMGQARLAVGSSRALCSGSSNLFEYREVC